MGVVVEIEEGSEGAAAVVSDVAEKAVVHTTQHHMRAAEC